MHTGRMKYLMPIFGLAAIGLLFSVVSAAHETDPVAKERAHAPGDIDVDASHQLAREAVRRGDAAPLESIMLKARPLLKGEVVGIKFEQHYGVWMYEFRVVGDDGHMQYIHVDAKTGVYLEVGGHPCESC